MNFLAYLFALIKSIIYGTTYLFTGNLTETVDVLDVLALRFLFSLVTFWLLKVTGVCKIRVGLREFFVQNEHTPYLKNLILTALFEPVLYMFFETAGISQTSPMLTAILMTLGPIFSCTIGWLVARERTAPGKMLLLLVGMVGAIYIAVHSNSADGKSTVVGVICIMISMLCGSLFYAFSGKASRHFTPMEITYTSCQLGAIAFNAVNVVRHLIRGDILHYFDPYFDWENMIGFFVLGVLSTIVATAMNNYSRSRLQMSTLSAFGGVSTLVAVLVGVFFDGETLYYYHYIGFALILIRMIGVSAISIRTDKKGKGKTDAQK